MSQLDLSKVNQKYHMAIDSTAVPKMPGQRTTRTVKAAMGDPSSEVIPDACIAIVLARIPPKRENAATAQTKYTRRAVSEIIHSLLMGKYSMAVQVSTAW
ncbi:MAG: hypothetical protein WB952_11385 [Terriglobales bacterium]